MLNTHYKKITTFLLSMVVFIGSIGFVYHKINNASAAIVDCTTIPGNFIQNCSFENTAPFPPGYIPSIAYPGYGFILNAGYTGINNWSVLGPIPGSNIAVIDVAGVSPQGNRFVDVSGVDEATPGVDGEQPGSGIEQVVSGLVVGQKYEVSFYHAGSGNTDMNVLLNGVSMGTFIADPLAPGDLIGSLNWIHQKFNFIATTNTATLTFRNDLPVGPNTLELDNISLVVVNPTPTITGPAVVNGPFTATITFDQVVTGLTLANLIVTNGTASALSAPVNNPNGTQTYTVTITPTLFGNVSINIPATNPISTFPITSNGGIYSNTSNTLNVLYSSSSQYSNVHIQSNNPVNTSYATTGNTITLTYTMDSVVPEAKQTIIIGGVSVIPTCVASLLVVGGQDCTATLVVPVGAPVPEGLVVFTITDNSVGGTSTGTTTDFSSVTIDRIINIVINTPGTGDDLGTFLIGGSCELGAGNVILSGSGFTPNPVATPCFNDGGSGSFEYEPVTGVPGAITITATQTDSAGNIGTDTNVYTYTVSPPTLPTVTISGPLGNASSGNNVITGTCTVSAGNVTISGTGFTPSSGTASCTGGGPLGTYSFPITVTGNTVFTASQTNGVGTAIATGSTTIPTVTTSGGGGCLPGYSCFPTTSNTPTTPVVTTNTSTTTPIVSTTTNRCPVFTQYLKKGMRDGKNGVSEISKIQSFLNGKLGLNLSVDGIFGSRTHTAVRNFQSTYFDQVLTPWGLTGPTGWWYQSTRSYANYLENCSEGTVPLDNGVRIQDGRIVN